MYLQINSYETCCCTACTSLGWNCHTANYLYGAYLKKLSSDVEACQHLRSASTSSLVVRRMHPSFNHRRPSFSAVAASHNIHCSSWLSNGRNYINCHLLINYLLYNVMVSTVNTVYLPRYDSKNNDKNTNMYRKHSNTTKQRRKNRRFVNASTA